MLAHRLVIMSLGLVVSAACAAPSTPTQRPPTESLEREQVLRSLAALSTDVLRPPGEQLAALEARLAESEGDARLALSRDLVRARVASIEGLLASRPELEAQAADAARESARTERESAERAAERRAEEAAADAEEVAEPPRPRRRAPEPEPEGEDDGWADADGDDVDRHEVDRHEVDRHEVDRHEVDRHDGNAGDDASEADGWGDDEWEDEGDGDDDDDWGDDEDDDDDWGDDDGWEDDGWSSKKTRRDRRARRDQARRRRAARARRQARQARQARRTRRTRAPQHAELAPEPPAPAPEASGPGAELAALDRQLHEGRAALQELAQSLPASAPVRAEADFAVLWIAWRTEAADAAERAAAFTEQHASAGGLVALAWMLRAELTYERGDSLAALRFGANRLGEPVYAYSLWRSAEIQRENGDEAAARESLLAVERAGCEADAPSLVRQLAYSAAEQLEHGVRRDGDGVLRPDTCPAPGADAPDAWRPEE